MVGFRAVLKHDNVKRQEKSKTRLAKQIGEIMTIDRLEVSEAKVDIGEFVDKIKESRSKPLSKMTSPRLLD